MDAYDPASVSQAGLIVTSGFRPLLTVGGTPWGIATVRSPEQQSNGGCVPIPAINRSTSQWLFGIESRHSGADRDRLAATRAAHSELGAPI